MSEQQQFYWPKLSFNNLGWAHTPQPKPHSTKYQSRCSQTQSRRIQSTTYPSLCTSKQEYQLIQGLLQTLGYYNTLSAFERERRRTGGQSNPQDSGQKIKRSPQPEGDFQETVHQIILESKNFPQMLQYLQEALRKQQGEVMQQQDQTCKEYQSKPFKSLHEYSDVQNRIQHVFSTKQKVLLPIFNSMEAELDGKQIKLAALNGQNNVCILDSDNYLHVIRVEEGKSISVKFDSKSHPYEIKWINDDLVLVLTPHTAYFYQAKNLKVELSIRTDEQPHCHEVYTLQNNLETQIYMLTSIQHKLVIRRLVCRQSMLNVLPKVVFSGVEQLKYITVLFAPLITEGQMIAESEQQDYKLPRCEQYYGLTNSQRSIVKFDTVVQKAGIFWKASSHFKIEELAASGCREYLLLVLSPQSAREDQDQQDRYHQNTLQYQIVKIDTKGCILEKVKYCLDCRGLPLGFFQLEDKGSYISKILNMSHSMHPSWLRCFSWNSQIYYFSLKSGRIIFNYPANSKEQSVVHAISSSNALLYSTKRHLHLISIVNGKSKKIQIQWHRKQSERQTMIQRLSRLQGIPENLLLILRSIRNHDLELMQLP